MNRPVFKSTDFPKAIAKRLKRNVLSDIRLTAAQQLTARVLGYRDWYQLHHACTPDVEGGFIPDDTLCEITLAKRRAYQVETVASMLGVSRIEAERVVALWLPTASRKGLRKPPNHGDACQIESPGETSFSNLFRIDGREREPDNVRTSAQPIITVRKRRQIPTLV